MLEIAKLCLIAVLPAVLIYTHRHKAALLWLGIAVPLDALSSSLVVRLTPLSMVGLISVPYVVHEFRRYAKRLTRGEVLVLVSCGLMVLGMVIYGFLYPWPDLTGERPLNQSSLGRSVIFTIRYVGDLCVALYIGYVIRRLGQPSKLLNYLLVGTLIAGLAVIAQLVTGIDFYYKLCASAPDLTDIGRARGLNFEPRIAAQWAVIGILLCIGISHLGKIRWPLLAFYAGCLAATLSTSGLVVLVFSLGVMATMLRRARAAFAVVAALGLIVVILSQTVPSIKQYREAYETLIQARLGQDNLDDQNLYGKIKDKMEVFDYAAVSFFEANPAFLILGTGPGTISIPASGYLRASDQQIYGDRIDSIPFGGLVQTVSNVGLIGLAVWVMLFEVGRRALLRMTRKTKQWEWQDAYILFVTFSAFFIVMIREMWLLVLGIALGAGLILRDSKPQVDEEV